MVLGSREDCHDAALLLLSLHVFGPTTETQIHTKGSIQAVSTEFS